MNKNDIVKHIKRKLGEFAKLGYYPTDLANCEESYKCLKKLNTTTLIKISVCLDYVRYEKLTYDNSRRTL